MCGCTYTFTLYFEDEEKEEEAKRQVSSTHILAHIFLLGFNNIELSEVSGSLAVADTYTFLVNFYH